MRTKMEFNTTELTDLVSMAHTATSLARQNLGPESGLTKSYEGLLRRFTEELLMVNRRWAQLNDEIQAMLGLERIERCLDIIDRNNGRSDENERV